MHLGAAFLLAFYMPLWCCCAAATAGEQDEVDAGSAEPARPCASAGGECDGAADAATEGQHESDEQPCPPTCDTCVELSEQRQQREPVLAAMGSIPSLPSVTVWAPLPPSVQDVVATGERGAGVLDGAQHDLPRDRAAPTLLSLAAMLLN